MTFIIDFRQTDAISGAASGFFEDLWLELAAQRPDAAFIFLCNEKPAGTDLPANITARILKSSSFKWLDQKKLLNLLNETKADAYIRFLPAGFLVYTPPGAAFLRKNLQQPAKLVCFSAADDCYQPKPAGEPIPAYPVAAALPDHELLQEWTATESTRIQYTGGKAFFLFTGDIAPESHLIELLKAFSIFKKWQQSNMQLVIAGYNSAWAEEVFGHRLANYKYRDDVVLLTDLADLELARLAAACYAMVYPCTTNPLPLAILYAIGAGVALVAADGSVNRAGSPPALWVDAGNLVEGLSSAMITLYRDENEKARYAQEIKAAQTLRNRKAMLDSIWEIIKQ